MTSVNNRRTWDKGISYYPKNIVNDDLKNGNVKIVENSISVHENTKVILYRIAFSVWHTALHIEGKVRHTLETDNNTSVVLFFFRQKPFTIVIERHYFSEYYCYLIFFVFCWRE